VLLDHGADVNARKPDYWTPLHLSASNGPIEAVELLLGRGADLRALNNEGQTPHELSMQSGEYPIADILKKHGAGDEKKRKRFDKNVLTL
jgi:ankyrin repeat protein